MFWRAERRWKLCWKLCTSFVCIAYFPFMDFSLTNCWKHANSILFMRSYCPNNVTLLLSYSFSPFKKNFLCSLATHYAKLLCVHWKCSSWRHQTMKSHNCFCYITGDLLLAVLLTALVITGLALFYSRLQFFKDLKCELNSY